MKAALMDGTLAGLKCDNSDRLFMGINTVNEQSSEQC